MTEDNELHVVLTAVVSADSAAAATAACAHVSGCLDGRITAVTDCSDEDPGCWAVSLARASPAAESAASASAVTLSGEVRRVLHALGLPARGARVHCVPPTAWTVLEAPEQVTSLVSGGQRLLVEARDVGMLDEVPHPAQ